MAIDFPANPTNGQVYANYIYDSSITAWRNVNTDTGIGTLNAMGLKNVVPTSVTVGSGSATTNANGTVTFTGASSILINGIFSSTYTNYRFLFTVDASVTGTNMRYRMSASGTPNSESLYTMQGLKQEGSAAVGLYQAGNANAGYLGSFASDGRVSFDIFTPYLTKRTGVVWQADGYQVAPGYFAAKVQHDKSVSYDGFYIFPESGTITGTLQVFGYTN